jgi:hypothetical protein
MSIASKLNAAVNHSVPKGRTMVFHRVSDAGKELHSKDAATKLFSQVFWVQFQEQSLHNLGRLLSLVVSLSIGCRIPGV